MDTEPNVDEIMKAINLTNRLFKSQIPIDCSGHFRGVPIQAELSFIDFMPEFRTISGDTVDRIAAILDDPSLPALETPMLLRKSSLLECSECGERLQMLFDGRRIYCKNPCPYPEGMPPYEWELNVPSGYMVVANDLRKKFDIVGYYDLRGNMGTRKTSLKYAEVGMAHAYVGNTCPGVYRIDEQHFVVGVKGKGRNPVPKSRCVASVCTDLWWYSIVDADQFRLAYNIDPLNCSEDDKRRFDVVPCKPGVYHFKHQYHLTHDEYPAIYSYIDWVREPDPVVDYQAKYLARNITAGQVIANQMKCFPTLYANDKTGMASAACYLLFGSAGHHHYHPNGFICPDPDVSNDSPSIDIPVFDMPIPYHDINNYCWLAQAAGVGKKLFSLDATNCRLNPSFVALSFNVCQAVVRHGLNSSHVKDQKTPAALCRKIIKGLAKQYPDQVPDNCKELI